VADKNVQLTMDRIRRRSPILKDMQKKKRIDLVGAMYDVNTGSVSFM
jgi:carbonic anhydrase